MSIYIYIVMPVKFTSIMMDWFQSVDVPQIPPEEIKQQPCVAGWMNRNKAGVK